MYIVVGELTVRNRGVSHVPLLNHFKEERMLARVNYWGRPTKLLILDRNSKIEQLKLSVLVSYNQDL